MWILTLFQFNVGEDVQFQVLKSAQKADFPVFYQVIQGQQQVAGR